MRTAALAVLLLMFAVVACDDGATETSATASSGGGGPGSGGASSSAGEGAGPGQGGSGAAPSASSSGSSTGPSTTQGSGGGGGFVEQPSSFDVEDLDHHRNRLLDTLVTRRGATDRCALWASLHTVEKGVLLTHTDMLGHRSCFDNASVPVDQMNDQTCDAGECTCDAGDPCQCAPGAPQAIDHVFQLWAINGTDPECCTGTDCCNGGGEWHRTFFSADDALIGVLRDVHAGLPEWADSGDFAGPHEPFSQSDETQRGSPRGQVHFWSDDAEAETLDRNGVEGVLDPRIVEMDQDFNILHDSNPEGTYSSTYGRAEYKSNWDGSGNADRGDALPTTFAGNGAPEDISELVDDTEWLPTCGPAIAVGGVAPTSGGSPGMLQLATHVTISGSFAATGNAVFVRTRAMAIRIDGASTYFDAESAASIEVRLPADLGTGEAFVMVESDGVLSNVAPVTIAP